MMDKIQKIPITEILSKFKTPLFIFDPNVVRKQYAKIKEAFTKRYPKTKIFYSYKTNYLLGVCSFMNKLGIGAEIVSGFELDLARKLNVNGKNIIFNGPCKKEEELKEAILIGTKINVDSIEELQLINSIGKEINQVIPVAIRVYSSNEEAWSRFGFSIESGEAREICEKIKEEFDYITLRGVHSHFSTNITNLKNYSETIHSIISFSKVVSKEEKFNLEYIDLGGGFPTEACFSEIGITDWSIPTIEEFAEIITKELNNAFLEQKPELFLEPGRYLVDDSFILLTKICSKRIIKGIHSFIVDGGTNNSSTFSYTNHKVDFFTKEKNIGKKIYTDIYGPLCMQSDILRLGVFLPNLRPGDVLIFKGIGAYSYSRSTPFIRLRPQIIGIDKNKIFILRDAEKTEDIINIDKLPDEIK